MDRTLLFLINSAWTSPALDRFMAIVTDFNVWLWPTILLMVLVWIKGGFRARAFVIIATLAVAVNDGIIARTLKRMTDRPRPHQMLNDVRQIELARGRIGLLAVAKPLRIKRSRAATGRVDGRSFPSSHTMNAFAVAIVCAFFYRRRAWPAFVAAFLVGYSRIYTGSHWPSDVLISIVISTGTTLLVLALCEALWPLLAQRTAPRLLVRHPTLLPR
jgi:undecaprenyl-diphosphatase